MTSYTVEENWKEHGEHHEYTRKRAVRKATAGCVCDACDRRDGCLVECREFKIWVSVGARGMVGRRW